MLKVSRCRGRWVFYWERSGEFCTVPYKAKSVQRGVMEEATAAGRQRELRLVGGFGWRAILFNLSLDEQFRAAGLWRGIGLSTIRGGSGGLL